MANNVNINPKVDDNYYRYKMPRIVAKIEGRGNGIKTLIVNLADVTKALKRPVMYALKYIGCELGAQTNADNKHERYIVNGAHDCDKIQDVLYNFIEKFVLCPDCCNPETNLQVLARKEKISLLCRACGSASILLTNHKVVSYILKNPPKQDKPKKPVQVPQIDTKEKKQEKTGRNNIDIPDQDIKWSVDVTEDAVKRREEELGSNIGALTVSKNVERPLHERLELLVQFIRKEVSSPSDVLTHKDAIMLQAKSLNLKGKFVFAICSYLFDHRIIDQLQKYYKILYAFTKGDEKVQNYVLGWVERLIDEQDHLRGSLSIIFKILYEADIVEEDVFLEWASKTKSRFVPLSSFQKIKEAANKFIDWLKNTEEESSEEEEEDDDEDDDEAVHTNNRIVKKLSPPQQINTHGISHQDESDEELDIDNI